jgi:hypothetical protein
LLVQTRRDLAQRVTGPEFAHAGQDSLLGGVGLQVKPVFSQAIPIGQVSDPLAIPPLVTQRIARAFTDRFTLPLLG